MYLKLGNQCLFLQLDTNKFDNSRAFKEKIKTLDENKNIETADILENYFFLEKRD